MPADENPKFALEAKLSELRKEGERLDQHQDWLGLGFLNLILMRLLHAFHYAM